MVDHNEVNTSSAAAKIAVDHWQEIKLLHDAVTKTWSIYFQWFQWYWALTLAAVYFVVNNKIKVAPLIVLGFFWILSVIFSVALSIGLAKYIRRASRQIDRLIELSQRRVFGTSAEILLPDEVANWVHFNSVVLSFAGIGWAYIMIWQPY
jgi:hypothetical protein